MWTPPSPSDVARLIPSRTVDRYGSAEEFTADTRPTRSQVDDLLGSVVNEVEAMVGSQIPDSVAGLARTVVIYGTASRIELAYHPESLATGYYDRIEALYRAELAALVAAVEAGGEPASMFNPPSFSFPDAWITDDLQL